jgi:RHS repeat-associated protein
MTWNGSTPVGGSFVAEVTYNKYSTKGLPIEVTVQGNSATANWSPETYTWEPNGLIKTKTFLNHTTTYAYYPNTRLLQSITDIDGKQLSFEYDGLMRLKKTTSCGGVVTDHSYYYKQTTGTSDWSYVGVKTTYPAAPISGSALTNVETRSYVDGLGRPLQMLKKGWSPAGKDVVIGYLYDPQGRQKGQYVPVESSGSTGAYFSIPTATKSSLIGYENSPLNRTISVTPPDWFATTTSYGKNLSADAVISNHATNAQYADGELLKTLVTDPNGNKSTSFTDKKGRLVLSRRSNSAGTSNADTYYYYDDKNRVTKIIPPGAAYNSPDLLFEYTYDGADNMLTKKVPDMGLANMRYNGRDQLVLVQDANLTAQSKWMATRYDDYGRPLRTGFFTGSVPTDLATANTALEPTEVHTEKTYGTTGIEKGKVKTASVKVPGQTNALSETFTYDACGRVSGKSGSNHLTNVTGSDAYTYTYDWANNRLREIRTHKSSPTATALTLTQRWEFDASGRNTNLFHTINSNPEQWIANYAYDSRDRMTERNLGRVTSGTINTWLQSLDYAYNEQNWLESLNKLSTFSGTPTGMSVCSALAPTPNPAETSIAAGYNPDVNDLFKLDLKYNNPVANPLVSFGTGSPANVEQKNGNISQLLWQVRGRQAQGYNLFYDYLDRLTNAYYANFAGPGYSSAGSGNQLGEQVTYKDARGNIDKIKRYGYHRNSATACWSTGVIDDLTFTYGTGNRLSKVAEAASASIGTIGRGFHPGTNLPENSYYYDANGNMIQDDYKAISLLYNHLNLPTKFDYGSGKSIDILYDQAGTKLRKTVKNVGSSVVYTQDYLPGGLEYRSTGAAGALTVDAIYHAEGRITPNGSAWRYEFNIKDHLGNTRLTFADVNNNKIVDVPEDILQENHYYPFGMNASYSWMNNATLTDNAYQYNGIERNDDFGLNLDLAFFRSYDASISRWLQTDPRPNYNHSLYSGMGNNPVFISDVLGDTLRAVSERSAERGLSIIQGSFANLGLQGFAVSKMFSIGKDGLTFNAISKKAFDASTKGLSKDAKALAKGYYNAINSKDINTFEIIKRSEKVSAIGLEALASLRDGSKTGADIDNGSGGGFTAGNRFDGIHAIVVMDAKTNMEQYSDGVLRPHLPGEAMAHELLGHGLGGMATLSDGLHESIQMGNIFLRVSGKPYYRMHHGVSSMDGKQSNPRAIPDYLYDDLIDPFKN